ncbi:MAG: hypothetical protein HY521_08270 [Proteobacteria bacterium]|nr:hypothetical protein [Pseudomonadota bacterium]
MGQPPDASQERPEQNKEARQSNQQQAGDQSAKEPPGVLPEITPTEPTGATHNQDSEDAEGSNSGQPLSEWEAWVIWRDTLAQWVMAFFGVIATCISIWAVILLWRTLSVTRKAVEESRRATKAAEDAVAITKTTAEQQLRAYMSVKDNGLAWELNRTIWASIGIENCGQTPAYQVKGWLGLGDEPEERPPEPRPTASQNDVGPGHSIHIANRHGPMDEQMWDGIRSRNILFYMWGELSYVDAFGKSHITKFKVRLDPDPRENAWVTCEDGNYSD